MDPEIQRMEGKIDLLISLATDTEKNLNNLTNLVVSVRSRQAANQAVLVSLLNSPPPVPQTLLYRTSKMAITTDINLAGGGTSDQINVEDENGVPMAASTITWSPAVGEANAADLVMVLSDDGLGTKFTADANAPTENVTMHATWTDPSGVAPPVDGPMLTVHIVAAVRPAPTALQYNEVSGT